MNAINIIALVCIFYEFIKLFFINDYWNFGVANNKKSPFFIADILYAAFATYLLFTPYYWIGIAIWVISITTTVTLHKKISAKYALDKYSRAIIFLDGMFSVVIFMVLIALTYYKF